VWESKYSWDALILRDVPGQWIERCLKEIDGVALGDGPLQARQGVNSVEFVGRLSWGSLIGG
jgi:hypothetical protein